MEDEDIGRFIEETFPELAEEHQADLKPCSTDWNRERPLFIGRMGGRPLVFEELWAELEPLVPKP